MKFCTYFLYFIFCCYDTCVVLKRYIYRGLNIKSWQDGILIANNSKYAIPCLPPLLHILLLWYLWSSTKIRKYSIEERQCFKYLGLTRLFLFNYFNQLSCAFEAHSHKTNLCHWLVQRRRSIKFICSLFYLFIISVILLGYSYNVLFIL